MSRHISEAMFYAFRLLPGDDLVCALRDFVRENKLQAGFIAGAVGSLSSANLRFAGKQEATLLDGCYELLSLSGTLDPEGEHLHAAISDPKGEVFGGHVMEGCIVRTTMELLICSLSAMSFSRAYCPASTYDELCISSR